VNREAFLRGERVYLRALNESDAGGNYLQWFNDSEVCRFNNHHRFPYSFQGALAYIEFARSTKDALILAIVASESDEHIGNIALQNIDYLHRSAEYAIVLGQSAYWGQGYAKEASQLIVDHGFGELNLNRIGCGTYATNIGMQKLARALGFVQEGVKRSAVFKNHAYVDIYEYGLLREEWNRYRTEGRGNER